MDIPPDNPNTQKEKPRRYFSLQNFSTYFDNLRVVTGTSPRKEKKRNQSRLALIPPA
jgi:hypothetical protein